MESDNLNQNYPATAPPPYPGPPVNTGRSILPPSSGPHTTYTAYPNQTVTVTHGTPVVAAGVQHIVITNTMSPGPAAYRCPSCNQQIITRTEKKTTVRTHVCAALFCIVGCFPCALIPYCVDSCHNIDHYCPNCSAYIGSYIQ